MTAPVGQYQGSTEALAGKTAVGALAVYAAYRAGDFSVPEAATVIATAVATANAVATTLADTYVSHAIEQATGVPTPTAGLVPEDDTERLTRAVRTILDANDAIPGSRPTTSVTPVVAGDATEKAGPFMASQEKPDESSTVNLSPEPAAGVGDAPSPTPEDQPPDPTAMKIERLAHSEPLAAAQQATVEVMDAQPAVIGWRRQMDADPCQLCKWWYMGGRIYRTTTAFQSHPSCNCQPEPVYASNYNAKEKIA